NLLNDLYRRGLTGKSFKLIISDGSQGIIAACNTIYPYQLRITWNASLRRYAGALRYKATLKTKGALIFGFLGSLNI
ncbi:MAG: hypothetical protein NC912_03820, partial [Candidatus Omnitrophica bacterium]|nr:hypothetical protein [Candidatus Omnitrophota bacterium]